ncbi:hypothetical protein Ddc_16033 [Ditylenchus destructor]|nr:hypothetical protein Ddc_16033 [Ditylenchus destructor]
MAGRAADNPEPKRADTCPSLRKEKGLYLGQRYTFWGFGCDSSAATVAKRHPSAIFMHGRWTYGATTDYDQRVSEKRPNNKLLDLSRWENPSLAPHPLGSMGLPQSPSSHGLILDGLERESENDMFTCGRDTKNIVWIE